MRTKVSKRAFAVMVGLGIALSWAEAAVGGISCVAPDYTQYNPAACNFYQETFTDSKGYKYSTCLDRNTGEPWDPTAFTGNPETPTNYDAAMACCQKEDKVFQYIVSMDHYPEPWTGCYCEYSSFCKPPYWGTYTDSGEYQCCMYTSYDGYRDQDGDGYGNELRPIHADPLPEGYVTNSSDCNDYEAGMYPGGTETCDKLDNDCNGQIDDGIEGGCETPTPPDDDCSVSARAASGGATSSAAPGPESVTPYSSVETAAAYRAIPAPVRFDRLEQVPIDGADEAAPQVTRQEIGLLGTGLSLAYHSDRVLGYNPSGRKARIYLEPASGTPLGRKRVEVTVAIAGQVLHPQDEGQGYVDVMWDGKDSAGKFLSGGQWAQVKIEEVYNAGYRKWECTGTTTSGACSGYAEGAAQTEEVRLSHYYSLVLDSSDSRTGGAGLGGWYLSALYQYDPVHHTLSQGGGPRRRLGPVETSAAGWDVYGGNVRFIYGDGKSTAQVGVVGPRDIGLDAGKVYAAGGDDRIYEYSSAGAVTVAGPGECYQDPTSLACVDPRWPQSMGYGLDPDNVTALAVNASGNVCYADGNRPVTCLNPATSTVVDSLAGVFSSACPSGPSDFEVTAMAATAGGSLYLAGYGKTSAKSGGYVVRYSGGTATIVLGDGSVDAAEAVWTHDGEAASSFKIGLSDSNAVGALSGIAVGPDGKTVYLIVGQRLLRIDSAGRVYREAGCENLTTRAGCYSLQRTISAKSAAVTATKVDVGSDGTIVLGGDPVAGYAAIGKDGRLTVIGSDYCLKTPGASGEICNVPLAASAAGRGFQRHSTGEITAATAGHTVAHYRLPQPGAGVRGIAGSDHLLIRDGGVVAEFDGNYRHVATYNAATGGKLLDVAYTEQGEVAALTDAYGRTTRFDRSQAGKVRIAGPDGIGDDGKPGVQSTGLEIESDGYLHHVTMPAGKIDFDYTLSTSATDNYEDEGLMTYRSELESTQYTTFGYDDERWGLLHKTTKHPEGLTVTCDRAAKSDGYTVMCATGGARSSIYDFSRDSSTGLKTRSLTDAASDEVVTSISGDERTVTTATSGKGSVKVTLADDPIWGSGMRYAQEVVETLPSQKTRTTTRTVSAALTNPADARQGEATRILSTTVAGAKTTEALWEGKRLTLTVTSPMGRQTQQTVNQYGQLLKEEVLGSGAIVLPTPVQYFYDDVTDKGTPTGKISRIVQGERTIAYRYFTGADIRKGLPQSVDNGVRRQVMNYDLATGFANCRDVAASASATVECEPTSATAEVSTYYPGSGYPSYAGMAGNSFNGRAESYAYYPGSFQLQSVQSATNSQGQKLSMGVAYKPDGQLGPVTVGGEVFEPVYDGAGRTDYLMWTGNGQSVSQWKDFSYDTANRLSGIAASAWTSIERMDTWSTTVGYDGTLVSSLTQSLNGATKATWAATYRAGDFLLDYIDIAFPATTIDPMTVKVDAYNGDDQPITVSYSGVGTSSVDYDPESGLVTGVHTSTGANIFFEYTTDTLPVYHYGTPTGRQWYNGTESYLETTLGHAQGGQAQEVSPGMLAKGADAEGKYTAIEERVREFDGSYSTLRQVYTLDEQGRIEIESRTRTTKAGTETTRAEYHYDAGGNRTTFTEQVEGDTEVTAINYGAADAWDRVTQAGDVTIEYDGARGHVNARKTKELSAYYQYNPAESLIQVSLRAPGRKGDSAVPKGEVRYEWDEQGRLVRRYFTLMEVTSSDWRYRYAGGSGQIAAIVDSAGRMRARFLYEAGGATPSGMLYRDSAGGKEYRYTLVSDTAGSLRAIATAGGTMIARYDYDAFGRIVWSQTAKDSLSQRVIGLVPFRFRGAFLDADTGLLLVGNKAYDPTQGRFLNRVLSGNPYTAGAGSSASAANLPLGLVGEMIADTALFSARDGLLVKALGHTAGLYASALVDMLGSSTAEGAVKNTKKIFADLPKFIRGLNPSDTPGNCNQIARAIQQRVVMGNEHAVAEPIGSVLSENLGGINLRFAANGGIDVQGTLANKGFDEVDVVAELETAMRQLPAGTFGRVIFVRTADKKGHANAFFVNSRGVTMYQYEGYYQVARPENIATLAEQSGYNRFGVIIDGWIGSRQWEARQALWF